MKAFSTTILRKFISNSAKLRCASGAWGFVCLGMVAFTLGVSSPQNAFSKSSLCNKWQAQMDNPARNQAPSAKYKQYTRAIKDQQHQVNRANSMAKNNGCSNLFAGTNRCKKINNALSRMKANMAKLKKDQRRYAPQKAKVNVAAIRRKMRRAGCFESAKNTPSPSTNQETASIGENNMREVNINPQAGDIKYARPSGYTLNGSYRTFCVRTCDGYYFPISFSAKTSRFKLDEKICSNMCPGTQTQLFYLKKELPSEEMISFRENKPYANMSTAFSYRKQIDRNCKCGKRKVTASLLEPSKRANRGFKEIAGTKGESSLSDIDAQLVYRVAVPVKRPSIVASPENYSNIQGGLSIARARAFSSSGNEDTNADQLQVENETENKETENKEIRIVGPAFFPDQ